MPHSPINPHKLKKNVSRLFNKKKKSKTVWRKKDYSADTHRDNPVRKKRESKKVWKQNILLFILVACIISCFGLLFFHPFFHIRKIEISGTNKIDKHEFKSTISGILDYNKAYILPGASFFMVNLDELTEILEAKYPLKNIVIEKKFPNNLIVLLEEKLSTVIYDNGKYYSYLGSDGAVVELIQQVNENEWYETTVLVPTTTVVSNIKSPKGEESNISTTSNNSTSTQEGTGINNIVRRSTSTTYIESIVRTHKPDVKTIKQNFGDYPIIYDKRHLDIDVNKSVLNDKIVQGVLDWYYLLNRNSDIPVSYIIIENTIGSAQIMTHEGWYLEVNVLEDIAIQFEQLKTVLADEDMVNRSNLSYINLRYDDRVYIR